MKWLRRLFPGTGIVKPYAPGEDRRGMGDDFKVGDLAVCIVDDWAYRWDNDPKLGDVLRVSDTYEATGNQGIRSIFLRFKEKNPLCGWDHLGFRKVEPDTKACEHEFAEQIKRLKPERLPVKIEETTT